MTRMSGIDDRRVTNRDEPRRRQLNRQRCLLLGYLSSRGSDRFASVQVTNLSTTGAKLRLGDMQPIGDGMVLAIPRFDLAYELKVVWRDMPAVGVMFSKPYSLKADPSLQAFLRSAAGLTKASGLWPGGGAPIGPVVNCRRSRQSARAPAQSSSLPARFEHLEARRRAVSMRR